MWNLAWIRSWKQPVLSTKGNLLCHSAPFIFSISLTFVDDVDVDDEEDAAAAGAVWDDVVGSKNISGILLPKYILVLEAKLWNFNTSK